MSEETNKTEIMEQVIECMYQIFTLGVSIDQIFEEGNIDPRAVERLQFVFGKLDEAKEQINANLKSGWHFDKLPNPVKAILVNAYVELKYDELDKSMVISNAVDMTKGQAPGDDYKYVNAVLDKIK